MFCIFTGCGASVSTDMTVDKDFSGERKIILQLDNDDLSYVDGGIGALEKVIKSNIPKDMKYSVSNYSGGKKITFKISFKNLQDYRTKVSNIIKKGADVKDKTTEVTYERSESYFKKGILFEENFSSVDLLNWYKVALRKAKIISESEGNWYESGSTKLTLEGKEYSSLSVNTQENSCLSSAEVTTTVLVDNTFERTITFRANASTIEQLKEKGCVLNDYLKGLAPEKCEFTESTDDDGDNYNYTFSFTAKDADDLVAKTNAILQTNTNTVTLESVVNEDRLGYANVTYSELLDGSYYLDYDSYYSNPLSSRVKVYNNTTLLSAIRGESDLSYNENEGEISYSASQTTPATFNMEWKIQFSEVDFSLAPKGKDKISITFNCALSKDLSKDMKKSAIDRMKSLFNSEDDYEAGKNDFSFTLTGPYQEVADKFNFILTTASEAEGEDVITYFSISPRELKTNSILTTASSYSVNFDVTPLFGDMKIKVDESKNILGCKYYVGDTEVNEDGEVFITSNTSFDLHEIKLSIVIAIILVLSGALIIFGIICLLLSLKPLKEYSAHKKEQKAEAARLQAEQQAEAQAAAPAAPVAPATEVLTDAPVAPAPQTVPVVEDTEEEEDLI